MNKNDVNRALSGAVNHIKDVTARNVLAAISSDRIKVDRATVPSLIALINQSIDQGNAEISNEFSKTLEKLSVDVSKPTKKK
jgi:hypothetical protein